MTVTDREALLRVQQEKIQPLDIKNLKSILVHSITDDDQLAELQTGIDVPVTIKKGNLFKDKLDRKTVKKAFPIIGRSDIATQLEIYLAAVNT